MAGYTQVVKADNVLYISGTVSREITPEEIKNVYTVPEKSLQQFGTTFQNVVKENLYTDPGGYLLLLPSAGVYL